MNSVIKVWQAAINEKQNQKNYKTYLAMVLHYNIMYIVLSWRRYFSITNIKVILPYQPPP